MKLDDSPESLDAMLRGASMPGQAVSDDEDPMPDGMVEGAVSAIDAHNANDPHRLAKAIWNMHGIAHRALTEEK